MNRKDWRTVSIEDVNLDGAELARQLIPTLRFKASKEQESFEKYGHALSRNADRPCLSCFPSRKKRKKAFLDLLLDHGEVDSTMLTDDSDLQQRIRRQPLLEWKAVNVRKHKGL